MFWEQIIIMRALPLVLATALPFASVTSANAWDSYGHMSVAYVAYQQLTPQATQRVNELLKLNPNFSEWLGWVPKGMSTADTNMVIFMLAATWPDEIKSESGYSNDGANGGDSPVGSPDPTANIGYTDMMRHKYWHFVDEPFATDGSTLPAIPNPNAQERVALFRGVLASTSDDNLKSYDLTWLLHLVGDVHQPLHCATRVSSADPKGDNGGNNVTLNGSPNELHMFWDDVPGTGEPKAVIKAVIKSAKKLPAPNPALAAKTSESDWVAESFQAAQDDVYQPPILAGNGPFTLSAAYKNKAKTLAGQRLALAGARLANLINNELK
jgi:hypothetical protein